VHLLTSYLFFSLRFSIFFHQFTLYPFIPYLFDIHKKKFLAFTIILRPFLFVLDRNFLFRYYIPIIEYENIKELTINKEEIFRFEKT